MEQLEKQKISVSGETVPAVTAPEQRESNHFWVSRIVAFILAVVMLAELALVSKSRISFDSSNYADTAKYGAASYLESTDSYLSASDIQRMRELLKMVGTPKTYEECSMCASVAIADEDYESAAEYMKACIALYEGADEGYSNLMLKLGCVHSLLSQWKDALDCFITATEKNPENASAWLLSAEANLQLGNYNAALDRMETYKSLQTLTADQYSVIAALQLEVSKYEEAVKSATIALSMPNCDRIEALKIRTQANLLLGDIDAAREDAQTLKTEGGDNAEMQTVLALCAEAEGDYEGALAMYYELINNGSDNVGVYEEAVQCAYLADEYRAMIDISQRALELQSDDDAVNAVFNKWLGVAQLVEGYYASAAENLSIYLSYDEGALDIYYFRGLCYMGNENYQKAVSDFSVSINNSIMIDESLYNRAVCYLQLDNADLAGADFQRILDRNAAPDVVAETRELLSL